MDQKAKHIECMVQFAHLAYPKYQESGLEAYQQKQAEVKQASIEPAGFHLKIQKGQIKQMEEENQRKGTQLKKKIIKGKNNIHAKIVARY